MFGMFGASRSYLVSGNAANAKYLGQTLGDLYVVAMSTHLGNLVNKWFLGLIGRRRRMAMRRRRERCS